MLGSTKPIAKSISESSIVPSMPISRVVMVAQPQPLPPVNCKIARYPTAMPNVTQKNTGVKKITSVIVKNAVITPTIMLATTATNPQLTFA